MGISSDNTWLKNFDLENLNNIYYGKIPKILKSINLKHNDGWTYIENKNKEELTSCAISFINSRYTDPLSSFGDCLVFNSTIDTMTAKLIKNEVSDCIVAPDYSPEALEILKKKKK